MRRFSQGDLTKRARSVSAVASREPVTITHNRKPRFVPMSVERFEELAGRNPDRRERFTIETMPDDLRDGLLALADRYESEAGGAD